MNHKLTSFSVAACFSIFFGCATDALAQDQLTIRRPIDPVIIQGPPIQAFPLTGGPTDYLNSSGAQGAQGSFYSDEDNTTRTQTFQYSDSNAPTLAGATNGTIGPQGRDATFITGVNTAGTVRVNNLANLEALLNILANGLEILGIAWGGPTIVFGFMHMAAGSQDAMKKILFGCAGVTGGLATPGVINWLVASSRDANLFS